MARAKLSSPFASQRTLLNIQTWSRDDLAELARLVEERSLTPMIDCTYTLEQVPEAVATWARGTHWEGDDPRRVTPGLDPSPRVSGGNADCRAGSFN
jgi:hypothetical protein